MTVVVAGYIDLENADHRDALIESARPYIEGAWAERGCIAYAFTPDPFNPNRIQVFEEWVEEQDLSDHLVGKPYCLLYTSPSPRDATLSRMPSSA